MPWLVKVWEIRCIKGSNSYSGHHLSTLRVKFNTVKEFGGQSCDQYEYVTCISHLILLALPNNTVTTCSIEIPLNTKLLDYYMGPLILREAACDFIRKYLQLEICFPSTKNPTKPRKTMGNDWTIPPKNPCGKKKIPGEFLVIYIRGHLYSKTHPNNATY